MSDATPSSESPAEKPPVSLWRRIVWIGGIFLVTLIVLGVSVFFFEQNRAQRELATTVHDLDETDPGWRFDEIEAAREPIPESKNSARLCVVLARHLRSGWPSANFDEKLGTIPMAERLDAERMGLLETEMKRLAGVRLVARPLADMPRGRHDIHHALNPLATLLPDIQETRKVAALFQYEMIYLSNKGDVSGAVRSGRACVCAGRSMYDEPFMISQLVRIAIIAIAAKGVERSLSMGESSEEELIALQKLLADEEKQNTFLLAIRGERATMDLLFSRVASGAIPTDYLAQDMGMGNGSWLASMAVFPRWQFRRQQPIMLDMMTRAVENARLPAHEQPAGEKKMEGEIREKRVSTPLVAMLLPATHKVAEACRRKTAVVSTMRSLLAVERYRMKHGRWPGKLEDVVPAFLDGVPLDPFDGKPLRYVRVAEGVVVYSVGPDGTDDGGKLDRENPVKAGTDLGYQLWDKAKRRQPAKPAAKKEAAP